MLTWNSKRLRYLTGGRGVTKSSLSAFFLEQVQRLQKNAQSLGVAAGILILLFAAPMVLRAQAGSGTILGSVTDQSGAVVQGASVTLRNEATNVSAWSYVDDETLEEGCCVEMF